MSYLSRRLGSFHRINLPRWLSWILQASRDDPTTRALLLANLVTIVCSVVEGWSLGVVMFVYWMQNVIIGIFTMARMLTLTPPPGVTGEGIADGALEAAAAPQDVFFWRRGVGRTRRGMAITFIAPYGLFHMGYLAFLRDLVPDLDYRFIALTALVFFVNHLWSFLHYRRSEKGSGDTATVTALVLGPYRRIIPMHLILIPAIPVLRTMPGGILEAIVLVLFQLGKTAVDVYMHLIQHRKRAA